MLLTERFLITIMALCLALEIVIFLPLGFGLILEGHEIIGMLFIFYWIFIVYELKESYKETVDK